MNLRRQTAEGSLKSLLSIQDLIETSDDVVGVINPYMFDVIDCYNAVKAANKKLVFGLDVNVAYGNVDLLRLMYNKPYSVYTLVVLNPEGYKNLVKLSTFAYREGMYQVPRIDWSTVNKYKDGLACIINSYNSAVSLHYSHGNFTGMNQELDELKKIFQDRLYFDEIVNQAVLCPAGMIPTSYDIPILNTSLQMYKTEEDYNAFKHMVAINEGFALNEVPYENKYHHAEVVQTGIGLYHLLSKVYDYGLDKTEIKLPESGISDEDFVASLHKRLEDLHLISSEYVDRLNYELNTIVGFGYKNYFLIVKDLIDYCNNNLSGYFSAGRGSVGGCLVAYLLGITRIDPVHPAGFTMQIPFDRFLNSGRKVMPDIDMDFMPKDRGEVIKYLQSKYGQDSVKHMTTQVTYGARSAIREVCRISEVLDSDMERIIKSFPNDQHLDLSIVKSSDIYTTNVGNENFVKAFQVAEKLEGLPRSLGIHASGIALASYNMEDQVPFIVHNSGKEATQYNQDQLDHMGIIKLDVLGVNALQIVKDTLGMVDPLGNNFNKLQWLGSLHLDDRAVFTFINTGDISGVFQWDTYSYKNVIKLIKPENFQQLVDLNTLGRSAALLSGLTQKYADRKNGTEVVEPLHPKLKGLMPDTYELPLYQEQIMMIFTSLAGYSLAEADDVRKAIGKKIPQLMEKQRLLFAERCISNGIEQKDAEEIWFIIDKFSKYTWNLGHAVAYTKLCYETAYLACHHPAEYYCAYINNANGTDDVSHFLSAIKKREIDIVPVDINKSDRDYKVVNKQVVSGFSGVKYVGEKVIDEIMNSRGDGFKSLEDIRKIPKKIMNKRAVSSLLACGAFTSFTIEGFESFKRIFGYTEDEVKDVLINQYHYSGKVNRIPYELFKDEKYDQIVDLIRGKKSITVLAYISTFREIYTKNKTKMAFLKIEDDAGQHEVTVFPSAWEKYGGAVKSGELHMLKIAYSNGLVANEMHRYVSDTNENAGDK